MIGILDYGVGNVAAFNTIYKRLNIDCNIVNSPQDIKYIDKIILPGVGSFDSSLEKLENSGLKDALDNAVLNENLPIMGVCVGMQMMANSSEEGKKEGLGYINGSVIALKNRIGNKSIIPHMGWNSIEGKRDKILHNIDLKLGFYFLHSYFFEVREEDEKLASVQYEKSITCAVKKNNIYGFQFHPEKSLLNGVNLLKNFNGI